jgi:hypothetical protein
MAYKPLILGSSTTSKESLSASLTKVNEMLAELYLTSFTGSGEILYDGGSAGITVDNLIIDGNDLSTTLDGGSADRSSNITIDFNSLTNVPSVLLNITDENFYNWNEAYEWGDHSAQGYLKSGDVVIPQRTTISETTPLLQPDESVDINLNGFKGYILYKLQTNAAAWVRIYTGNNERTLDTNRTIVTDPTPGSGVVAEIITSGDETVNMAPATIGFNNEVIPVNNIPIRVTNKSNAAVQITVSITLLQLEA